MGGPLSPHVGRALDEVFQNTPLGQRVASYKIWAPDGTVLIASDAGIVGLSFPVDSQLRAALGGIVAASNDDAGDGEDAAEAASGVPLLEICSPIHESWSGRIVAAAEFHEANPQLADDLPATAQAFCARSRWLVGMPVVSWIGGRSATPPSSRSIALSIPVTQSATWTKSKKMSCPVMRNCCPAWRRPEARARAMSYSTTSCPRAQGRRQFGADKAAIVLPGDPDARVFGQVRGQRGGQIFGRAVVDDEDFDLLQGLVAGREDGVADPPGEVIAGNHHRRARQRRAPFPGAGDRRALHRTAADAWQQRGRIVPAGVTNTSNPPFWKLGNRDRVAPAPAPPSGSYSASA